MTTRLSETIELGEGVTMKVYRMEIDPKIIDIAQEVFDKLSVCCDKVIKTMKVQCNGNVSECISAQDFAELCAGLHIQIEQVRESVAQYFQSVDQTIVLHSTNETP